MALSLVIGFASRTDLRAQPRAASTARYEQRLGERLPLDAVVTDEAGRPAALGTYFTDKPVVVVFGYFRCPQLCSLVSDATIQTLRSIRDDPGNSYRFLYFSIDPTDTPAAAAEAKRRDLRRFDRPGAEHNWHYLTASRETIRRVAAAAGFHFEYDPQSHEYAHATGFLITTPAGNISRYFLGLDFPGKEVSAALVRAGQGKIGVSVYDLVLLCIHGGTITGPYGRLIWRTMQVAAFGTVLGLACGIGLMLRRERRENSVRGT